ncbi:FadR/GntR family transcriptional regulator [Cohnella faecalis]|uniref:FadR family transcriptional regulator n=1 Tax=Cohnella faecalis TaxID=2315694 RepID=A0A398CFS4_9BACL|nr:FadR/GntR family transcriptional regulator [Cohnella faecalis]RIE01573.1 FadR family transcriptional regulator [Cohnella faecalis]
MGTVKKQERSTLANDVSKYLKQYIIDNNIGPGQKLPSERELSNTLQVSRQILREGLRSLESTGIISIRHGDGAIVQSHNLTPLLEQLMFLWKMDNKKISQLLDLRQIFELAAVDKIIANATEADFQMLRDLTLQMAQPAADTKAIQEADIEFHRALITATHNEMFMQLTDLIIEYFSKVSHYDMGPFSVEQWVQNHLSIVDALEKKDEILAKQVLRDHLDNSRQYLIDIDGVV